VLTGRVLLVAALAALPVSARAGFDARGREVPVGAESVPVREGIGGTGGGVPFGLGFGGGLGDLWMLDGLPAGDRPNGRLPLAQRGGPMAPRDMDSIEPMNLPAAPSSALLGLSALAGLGVWRLGRGATKLHWGAMPEWYHAGAPPKVGHVTCFDLQFDLGPALAAFLTPRSEPESSENLLPEAWRLPRLQPLPRTLAPRGPPL
jgi:hypothetical protein